MAVRGGQRAHLGDRGAHERGLLLAGEDLARAEPAPERGDGVEHRVPGAFLPARADDVFGHDAARAALLHQRGEAPGLFGRAARVAPQHQARELRVVAHPARRLAAHRRVGDPGQQLVAGEGLRHLVLDADAVLHQHDRAAGGERRADEGRAVDAAGELEGDQHVVRLAAVVARRAQQLGGTERKIAEGALDAVAAGGHRVVVRARDDRDLAARARQHAAVESADRAGPEDQHPRLRHRAAAPPCP